MKGYRCIMLILWNFIKYDDCNTTNSWRDPLLPSSSNRLLKSQCGSLLSGLEWLLPVWLNYFELYGNATVRCSPCRSSYLEILLHFCSNWLRKKKKHLEESSVLFFLATRSHDKQDSFGFTRSAAACKVKLHGLMLGTLGGERRLAGDYTVQSFFFLLLKTKNIRVKALILFIGIC